jgi:serine/threonine protein kinase
MAGGVSLEPTAATGAGHAPVQELLAQRSKKGERYIIEREIARGGMGAIVRAVDCDIRREVAVKYMLDLTDRKKQSRFIEEAQITGQLEHPNIVPIHELGVDAQKRLFFTMKMVHGRSLAQVLDELRKDPKVAAKEYSLGRLLGILVNVCNALAYAHSRGVVHRDLKPANIMMGDFGEVYVMDWGLAKVKHHGEPGASATGGLASGTSATGAGSGTKHPAEANSSVRTSREQEADLTQEGSVLGTPVYMPPEQAGGHVDAIDQRSDVYSLGAILYEMLTLQPPVARDGGYLDVLLRVMEGAIVPPEQRNPQRAKAGNIPKELSAVALKALAKPPQDRYPSVEALRRDLERFLEGRSVSAKEDKLREALWRQVKRNKAVSLVAAVGVLLLAGVWGRSAWINAQERRSREALLKKAVPALVRAAQFSVNEKNFADALTQATVAVANDPDDTAARLLKGQLLIVQKDYVGARQELSEYLRLKPADTDAARLAELCGTAKPNDAAAATAFADVFLRQNATILAGSMIQSQNQLLAFYKRTIDAAWPGAGQQLTMDKNGNCTLVLAARKDVVDLSPLKGMSITALHISQCPITDLTPLRGLPLQTLAVSHCGGIAHLTPLQGMRLTSLQLWGNGQIQDLAPLRGMPLSTLSLMGCPVEDLAPLQGMPLTSLSLHACVRVRDLTPLKGMRLTSLNLDACPVKDLTPLQGMALRSLVLSHHPFKLDWTPFQGMPLNQLDISQMAFPPNLQTIRGFPVTSLNLMSSDIEDLTPLQGLKLVSLNVSFCPRVTDLRPLRGMPLETVYLQKAGVRDLTPLEGMKLREVSLTPKTITRGLDVLRPMKTLGIIYVYTGPDPLRLVPADFWKKYDAGEFR